VVEIPESKHGSALAKVEHVIDTKVIVGCLDKALLRGAWDELFSFVIADTFRGLRIVVTPDTIVDQDDDQNHCVDTDQKAEVIASSLKGKDEVLASKMPASVRRAVERHRSKEAQNAHIALAVTGQMFRYQMSLNQSNPYAHTNPK